MRYLIFCIAIRVARWACVLGDSDDKLEAAEKMEAGWHYYQR
jgi:hypothetical protein